LGIRAHQDGGFTYHGRTVQAIVDPIGIDAAGFARQAVSAAHSTETGALRGSLNGKALAIGVDRLDYSKGLTNRFIAIGRLLAKYPEHQREVSFLQVAARSREDQHAYQRLRRELDRIVGETNGKYADFDWTPLRYMTRPVKRETLAGFFRIARIAMITPLRDGMNLVAKEYVAAQDPANPGVLVLSRLAGAADEMTAALLVNPFDTDEIADAMHQALKMDLEERRDRWQALNAVVNHNNADRFCSVFMSHLSGPRNYSDRPTLRAVS
jgi:trehalose 6-phosphate synthase